MTFIPIPCMMETIRGPDARFPGTRTCTPLWYTIVSHGFSIHMHIRLPCMTCLVYHISRLTDKL